MAASLKDTVEKSNGTKLTRLLIDGGTDAVRRVFDGIHPPLTLRAVLHIHEPVLTHLRHKKVITCEQWKKLYPPSGAEPESKNFDITLLGVLLRNICGLSPPVSGWDSLPLATDVSTEANIARIKYYRNEIYAHISSTGITKADFEKYWMEISNVLITLGVDSVSIALLKSLPLGETEYVKLLEDWTDNERSLKTLLHEEMGENRREIERAFKIAGDETKLEMEQTGNAVKENTQRLKKLLNVVTKQEESIQSIRKKSHVVLKKLAKSNFTGHIKSLVKQHYPGTGISVHNRVKHLLNRDQTQVLLLRGGPGVGKSVQAAVTCQIMQEQHRLAACQFIEYSNSLRNSPRLIIENIASQCSDAIPGFQLKLQERLTRDLGKELSDMNCGELFALLLEEPFSVIDSNTESMLIVIDALDECNSNLKEEFSKALFHVIPKLPPFLKFLITSRPTNSMIPNAVWIDILNIGCSNSDTLEDIQHYLTDNLQQVYPNAKTLQMQLAVSHLAFKSDGIFLFAHFAVDFIKTTHPALSQVASIFPRGISSVYEEYFTRLLDEIPVDEEKFFSFLEAVVATEAPLPEGIVMNILGLRSDSRHLRKAATSTLARLSQLFPSQMKHFVAFHRSVVEWLSCTEPKEEEEHRFSVDVNAGHCVLAGHCLGHLQKVKNHKTFPPPLDDCERYALTFGIHHMTIAGGFENQLKELLLDLELLSAKSLLSPLKELDSILETRTGELKELQQFIQNLDFFRNSRCDHYPQAVLQAAVNCHPESEFYKEAARLLKTSKYGSLPCIEFTHPQLWARDESLPVSSVTVSDFQVSTSGNVAACVGGTRTREPFVATSNICRRNFAATSVRCNWSPRCAISHNDQLLALAGKHVEILDTCSLQTVKVLKADTKPFSCCFLQLGEQLAVGYIDGTVRIWDTSSGSVRSLLHFHNGWVTLCASSQCGHLITGDWYGALIVWQTLDPPKGIQLSNKWLSGKDAATFSPDGTKIAAMCRRKGESDHEIALFSTASGELLGSLSVNYCTALSFVGNNRVLCGEFSHIRIWNVLTGKIDQLCCPRQLELTSRPHKTENGDFIAPFTLGFRDHNIMSFKLHNLK